MITLVPEVFRFRYPNQTHNAETLWVDPHDGAPYVLTKEPGTTCVLYRYPLPLDGQVEKTLQHAATLTGAPVSFTGGAVATDGRWIFARNYLALYAWSRAPGQPFAAALAAAPCRVPNVQGQAEAITVTADGRGMVAVSEGAGASIYRCDLSLAASAAWLVFGTGLAGANGTPGVGLVRAPILGIEPVTIALWQGLPATDGLVALSVTGYPDGRVPFRGGWLHAAPDALITIRTDAGGTALLPLGVLPDAPALRGLPVHGQAFLADAAAPQGVSLSAGLTLLLDR
jgi:hypothetical protein